MKLDRLSFHSALTSQMLPVCRSVSTLLIRGCCMVIRDTCGAPCAYKRVGGAIYGNR